MPITIEKMHEMGVFIERVFYPRKKYKSAELRGVFSDLGKRLKREGKTSIDLVRELREV
ncbi:MAG: hypothetical protein L6243_05290 [Candidatus Altiarchaeales archaeon]|nr:hypothetical protein [Candidatus Altiarchaeota archaeon]MBU4341364.1 hypothetical protein [Candidatus Altiarchaeota archaeon]MBU4406765.1 hypothetical protein [Candidatus Altiarchaeota archaeon]MBU4436843.1 hypothetical protein [Candidatus Altiarchaeota archaeon]MCG2782986.1 hypothetical protein [Candidatus Altiarchaeales archaeon]